MVGCALHKQFSGFCEFLVCGCLPRPSGYMFAAARCFCRGCAHLVLFADRLVGEESLLAPGSHKLCALFAVCSKQAHRYHASATACLSSRGALAALNSPQAGQRIYGLATRGTKPFFSASLWSHNVTRRSAICTCACSLLSWEACIPPAPLLGNNNL